MTTKAQLYLNELGDQREIAALREVVSLLVEELDDPARTNQRVHAAVWLSEPLRLMARAALRTA